MPKLKECTMDEDLSMLNMDKEDRVAIYQCIKCKNVVGNERLKVDDMKDEKFIYLQEVDNCLMQTTLKSSSDPVDRNCHYRILECCLCHEILGRQYCKVARHFQHLKNLNALFVCAVGVTHTKIPAAAEISQQVVHDLMKRVKALEEQLKSQDSVSKNEPQIQSAQFEDLETKVEVLSSELAAQSTKIDDLAFACIEACKDRVSIKEAVANLLKVISEELDGKEMSSVQ